jgi:hypothetical protein
MAFNMDKPLKRTLSYVLTSNKEFDGCMNINYNVATLFSHCILGEVELVILEFYLF